MRSGAILTTTRPSSSAPPSGAPSRSTPSNAPVISSPYASVLIAQHSVASFRISRAISATGIEPYDRNRSWNAADRRRIRPLASSRWRKSMDRSVPSQVHERRSREHSILHCLAAAPRPPSCPRARYRMPPFGQASTDPECSRISATHAGSHTQSGMVLGVALERCEKADLVHQFRGIAGPALRHRARHMTWRYGTQYQRRPSAQSGMSRRHACQFCT